MRSLWDRVPWTRVSFGNQIVVDPEGQYILAVTNQHFRGNESEAFRRKIEGALKRFSKIREFERGSDEEARAIATIQAEIKARNPAPTPLEFTHDIFVAKFGLETRFPGVFTYPDPEVRRQVAEHLGQYSEEYEDPGFRPGGAYYEIFGVRVADLLGDEDAEVRRAAAQALHRFLGEEIPQVESEDEALQRARVAWEHALGLLGDEVASSDTDPSQGH